MGLPLPWHEVRYRERERKRMWHWFSLLETFAKPLQGT